MSDTQFLLGKLVEGSPERDAVHIAVVAVTAAQKLSPGQRIGLNDAGKAEPGGVLALGIVDPFLIRAVQPGQTFFLFLMPNTITSLKHNWTHPAFPVAAESSDISKIASEHWMREWAVEHMSDDYYGDGDEGKRSPEAAYAFAIDAGRRNSVGPYEDARDHIDSEWWSHWEAITGERGDRDTYFSCAC
jgi:hypothetical protein